MTTDTFPGTPDAAGESPGAASGAALLSDLVDVLLPGDGDWPSGRDVGVQHPLANRLVEVRGRDALSRVDKALRAAGGPLRPLVEADRVAVVMRFEAAEPELFGLVRDAAYIAYYESPFVAEAINARGHLYELRPHIKGYPLPRFDVARDMPRHGRGRYIPTEDVHPVDVSQLDLASNRTQAWGLKR